MARALTLLVAAVGFVRSAAAEPDETTKAAARELARDGTRALEEGRYRDAQDLLDHAYRLYAAPTIAVLEARALVELGRLVEAAEHYERAVRTRLEPDASDAFHRAVRDAELELNALRPRIPELTIELDGVVANHPTLRVELDGSRVLPQLIGVRRPIDPGEHRVVARVGAGAPVERRITIVERQRARVRVAPPLPRGSGTKRFAHARRDPTAEQPDDGATERSWGYVGLAVGAVGIATGAIAGLVMLDKKSSLDDTCTPTCPRETQDDLDAFRAARTVSLVGYGVGVVSLVAGTVSLLTAPSGDRGRSTNPPAIGVGVGVGPGSLAVGAAGSFR